jgi:hypothetical protein
VGEREGWVVREGAGAGGRSDPNIVCLYEYNKKRKSNKKLKIKKFFKKK